MLRLLKDIYNHPETTDALRSFIRLRIKQHIVRDDFELKDFFESED